MIRFIERTSGDIGVHRLALAREEDLARGLFGQLTREGFLDEAVQPVRSPENEIGRLINDPTHVVPVVQGQVVAHSDDGGQLIR